MEGADDRRKRLKAMRAEAEASNGNDVGGAAAGKYIVFGFIAVAQAGRVV